MDAERERGRGGGGVGYCEEEVGAASGRRESVRGGVAKYTTQLANLNILKS